MVTEGLKYVVYSHELKIKYKYKGSVSEKWNKTVKVPEALQELKFKITLG